MFDITGDGILSSEQLMRALSWLGENPSPAQFQKVLDIVDHKGTDALTFQNMLDILSHFSRPPITEVELQESGDTNRDIEILANGAGIQAVKHSKLNISQIAFYKAGEVSVSKDTSIKMDSQGMAMIRMSGDRIGALSVSDPSRKLSRVAVTVSGLYQSEAEGVFMLPDKDQNKTLVLIDLPQGVYAGKSVTVAF